MNNLSNKIKFEFSRNELTNQAEIIAHLHVIEVMSTDTYFFDVCQYDIDKIEHELKTRMINNIKEYDDIKDPE